MEIAPEINCADIPFECAEEFHRSVQREFASGGAKIGTGNRQNVRRARSHE